MAKIKLIAFGCSNNQAESEIMAGLLKKAGHEIVDEKADITIVSLCNVKGPSFHKGLRAAKEAKGKVIVSGCIPKNQIPKISKELPDASIVSTHNICSIGIAVEKLLRNEKVKLTEKKEEKIICMPRIRKNKIIGIVPISSGCLGECSYCAVKAIKGQLVSYPIEMIVKEAEQCMKDGCREIWITAQDTGCYGIDINKTLPDLLKAVLEVKGDFKVRLGMANPNFICKYTKELAEIFKNRKMFRFLHIPIQSGSNKVLKNMNRHYTREQFLDIIWQLKKEVPDISISTDIIVGFPEETEKDVKETIEIIEQAKPNVLNLNRYWAMPGTKAAGMRQLRCEILKERCTLVLKAFQKEALRENTKLIGAEYEILVDEKAKNNSFMARTDSYRPVVVKGDFNVGERIGIRIVKVTSNYLVGEKI